MAKCSNCDRNVGCSCSLKNGLCNNCRTVGQEVKNISVDYTEVNPEDHAAY